MATRSLHSGPSGAGIDPGVSGLLHAFGAFLLWGLSPIYFKAMGGVPPLEILAHRVVWSALLMAGIVLALRDRHAILAALGWRRLGAYAATTVLISINWLLFIWGIDNGHLIQVSLGYYINPLVNVLLGVLFLSERLNRAQFGAVGLAILGVGVLVAAGGTLPWISLTLAFSFGLYALIRKKAGIDPLIGLLLETLLLTPVALGYLLRAGIEGWGALGRQGWETNVLLILAGVVTTVPLILFMYGAQRLKLSTIGLMQYLAPSLHLLLGVALYGERFTPAHAVAFAFIWTGLVLYSADAYRGRNAGRLRKHSD